MTVHLQSLHIHRSASLSSAVHVVPSSAVVSQTSKVSSSRKNKPFTAKLAFVVASKTRCLCILVIGSPSIGNHRLPQVHCVRRRVANSSITRQLLLYNVRSRCAYTDWVTMACVIPRPSVRSTERSLLAPRQHVTHNIASDTTEMTRPAGLSRKNWTRLSVLLGGASALSSGGGPNKTAKSVRWSNAQVACVRELATSSPSSFQLLSRVSR